MSIPIPSQATSSENATGMENMNPIAGIFLSDTFVTADGMPVLFPELEVAVPVEVLPSSESGCEGWKNEYTVPVGPPEEPSPSLSEAGSEQHRENVATNRRKQTLAIRSDLPNKQKVNRKVQRSKGRPRTTKPPKAERIPLYTIDVSAITKDGDALNFKKIVKAKKSHQYRVNNQMMIKSLRQELAEEKSQRAIQAKSQDMILAENLLLRQQIASLGNDLALERSINQMLAEQMGIPQEELNVFSIRAAFMDENCILNLEFEENNSA